MDPLTNLCLSSPGSPRLPFYPLWRRSEHCSERNRAAQTPTNGKKMWLIKAIGHHCWRPQRCSHTCRYTSSLFCVRFMVCMSFSSWLVDWTFCSFTTAFISFTYFSLTALKPMEGVKLLILVQKLQDVGDSWKTEKVLKYLGHGKKVYHLHNGIKHVPMANPSSVNAAPTLFFLFSFSLQLMECSTKFTVCEEER